MENIETNETNSELTNALAKVPLTGLVELIKTGHTLQALARHPDYRVRALVAARVATRGIHEALAGDPSLAVRVAVAGHVCTREVQQRLFDSGDPALISALAGNKQLCASLQIKIAEGVKDMDTLVRLAGNPGIDTKAAAALEGTSHPDIILALAGNIGIDHELCARLSKNPNAAVRAKVARTLVALVFNATAREKANRSLLTPMFRALTPLTAMLDDEDIGVRLALVPWVTHVTQAKRLLSPHPSWTPEQSRIRTEILRLALEEDALQSTYAVSTRRLPPEETNEPC
jgi:hypothetical protein